MIHTPSCSHWIEAAFWKTKTVHLQPSDALHNAADVVKSLSDVTEMWSDKAFKLSKLLHDEREVLSGLQANESMGALFQEQAGSHGPSTNL